MEFVYVVPRGELFPDCYPQGLHLFGEGLDERALLETILTEGFFVEREYAERTPDLKQIIPYTLIIRSGEVLLLRRKKSGGEARLFNKLSIGIGGHINPEDAPEAAADPDPVGAGSEREIREELDLEGEARTTRVGILNDDSNAVGAVHLGLVQVLRAEGRVDIRETEILEGRFVPAAELLQLLKEGANFESWSSILVERMDELVPELLATCS